MPSKQPKKDTATVPCPVCGGRKTVAWADTDIKCGACKGRGTVKA